MKRIALLIVALAFAISASSALANSPTDCGYSTLCSVDSNATPSNTNTSAVSGATGSTPSSGLTSRSTLPFTGLDVGLLAAGGGTLLGAGLVVRRLARGVN